MFDLLGSLVVVVQVFLVNIFLPGMNTGDSQHHISICYGHCPRHAFQLKVCIQSNVALVKDLVGIAARPTAHDLTMFILQGQVKGADCWASLFSIFRELPKRILIVVAARIISRQLFPQSAVQCNHLIAQEWGKMSMHVTSFSLGSAKRRAQMNMYIYTLFFTDQKQTHKQIDQ